MADGINQPSEQNIKITKKSKFDFDSIYKEIQEEDPLLLENREFWTRKGNSQKVICILCNIGIDISKNTNVLKNALLNHIKNKYHKKRYDASHPNDSSIIIKSSLESDQLNEKKSSSQNNITEDNPSINELNNIGKDSVAEINKILTGIINIYDSLPEDDPAVKTSWRFIKNKDNSGNMFCVLCKETIMYDSSDLKKFKFKLWMHVNENSHREKLPNYKTIQKKLEGTLSFLSKIISPDLSEDVKYFEIGPIHKYVKCSLCEVAIHAKPERLNTHLTTEEHRINKKAMMRKQIKIDKGTWKGPESVPNPQKRAKKNFTNLMDKINPKFKEEKKGLVVGKMPGYVLCAICSKAILPTKYYVESHLSSHESFHEPNDLPRLNQLSVKCKKLQEAVPIKNGKQDGKKLKIALKKLPLSRITIN